jgi:hypothetical protein
LVLAVLRFLLERRTVGTQHALSLPTINIDTGVYETHINHSKPSGNYTYQLLERKKQIFVFAQSIFVYFVRFSQQTVHCFATQVSKDVIKNWTKLVLKRLNIKLIFNNTPTRARVYVCIPSSRGGPVYFIVTIRLSKST